MYMQNNGYPTYLRLQERSSPLRQKGRKLQTSVKDNLWPKALLIWAAGAEEEDVEQEDVAYMAGNTRLP